MIRVLFALTKSPHLTSPPSNKSRAFAETRHQWPHLVVDISAEFGSKYPRTRSTIRWGGWRLKTSRQTDCCRTARQREVGYSGSGRESLAGRNSGMETIGVDASEEEKER